MITTFDPRLADFEGYKKSGLYCISIPYLLEQKVYKLGRAENIKKRMKQYLGYYSQICPVSIICFVNVSETVENEKHLFKYFKNHLRCNWYSSIMSEWIVNIEPHEIVNKFKEAFPNDTIISNVSQLHNKVSSKFDFVVIGKHGRDKLIIKPIETTKDYPDPRISYIVEIEDIKNSIGYKKYLTSQAGAVKQKIRRNKKS